MNGSLWLCSLMKPELLQVVGDASKIKHTVSNYISLPNTGWSWEKDGKESRVTKSQEKLNAQVSFFFLSEHPLFVPSTRFQGRYKENGSQGQHNSYVETSPFCTPVTFSFFPLWSKLSVDPAVLLEMQSTCWDNRIISGETDSYWENFFFNLLMH